MINAILIDDEEKNCATLSHFLNEYCPQVNISGIANNIQDAKKLIERINPQLIFLDVEMPYGSGFDLLKLLPEINFEIIFITGFSQYAINAFRFSALDYLLKPVNIEQLISAVGKAELRISEKNSKRNYEALLENLGQVNPAEQKILLTDKGEKYFIELKNILYCIADGSYTYVHCSEKTFLSSCNLKEFENLLPKSIFCRIHHGHLVNMNLVIKFRKGRGGSVVMQDGKELEIAVRKKDHFMKALTGLSDKKGITAE